MHRLSPAAAPLFALWAWLWPAAAVAGGYGGLDWGAPFHGAAKKLGVAPAALRPRPDLESLRLEQRVLRAEREAQLRQARGKKNAQAEVRRLKKSPGPKPRLRAYSYWTPLGALDARVLLHFFEDRLVSAELQIPFAPAERGAAGELLDLVERKYGAPTEHRGADAPGAPVVDVFAQGDTTVEAWQQPAKGGRGGLLHLVYWAKEQRGPVADYLEDLHQRLEAATLARHPQGPTPEEREAARQAALLQRL